MPLTPRERQIRDADLAYESGQVRRKAWESFVGFLDATREARPAVRANLLRDAIASCRAIVQAADADVEAAAQISAADGFMRTAQNEAAIAGTDKETRIRALRDDD